VSWLLALTLVAWAQAPNVLENEHFTLQAPQGDTLIGSPLILTGQLRLPAGSRVLPPTNEGLPPDTAILSVGLSDPAPDEDGETRQVRLELMLFALGDREIPALNWRIIDAGGMETTVETPAFSVTVTPPRPGLKDKGDIRDIKGPYKPAKWPYIVAILLLLGAIIGLAVWYVRRRNKPMHTVAPQPIDNRSPEEIALTDIDALPGLGLPVKDFYDRLSDIVRIYLERRIMVSAMSHTTRDLQRDLIRAGMDPAARALLKNLLERCDLAKFARYLPASSDLQHDCENAKRIVVTVGPKEQEPVGDLAGGGAT
jgi:hypothetical protein